MTRSSPLLVAAVAVFLAASPVVVVAQAPATSAGAEALPKLKAKLPRGEALEAQNRLNRELFTRLARGSNATPGVWMSGTRPEAALVVSTSLEGDVFQNLVTGLTAEGLQHAPSEFRFDDRTGTVVRYADGHPRQWMRVAMTEGGFYSVITLPTSLLDQSEAQNYRVYYKFSDDILIREANGKQTLHRWMPLEEAKKQLAAAERDRALAVQQAASGSSAAGTLEQQTLWRSRWGRLADLAGTSNFFYNPLTAEITPVTTNYEWAVPGWKMITSWIQPGQPKQKMAEWTWDPIARRIHLASEAAGLKIQGNATVGADGSVEFDTGGSLTQWRAGPDGSSEVAVTFANPTLTGHTTYMFQDQPRNREIAAAMASKRRQQIAVERAMEEAVRRQAQAERQIAKQEDRELLGAIMQGVAQGMAEVDAGGYADAQANLNATVANIQYAADVERQQQALAAQQEQARVAEANRQQLAENARWVAEKEQVAAEYRDGETQAAEARKAQLALKQQEDGQRRTAAEADRRKAQQDALREQGGVRAQATASGSLVLESVVNPSRRESTPPNSTADRQMLVACFLVHHGEFDQGKGVVFFSSTVPVAMEKGLAVGDPTGTFRRKVKSSYNIDGGTACQTLPDAAGLQSFMQGVGTSYRRYRKIDTGLSPLE